MRAHIGSPFLPPPPLPCPHRFLQSMTTPSHRFRQSMTTPSHRFLQSPLQTIPSNGTLQSTLQTIRSSSPFAQRFGPLQTNSQQEVESISGSRVGRKPHENRSRKQIQSLFRFKRICSRKSRAFQEAE